MRRLALFAAFIAPLSVAASVAAAPPSEPPESIVCRGLSAVGFSYEWGGECWCGSGCTPDLTNCQPGVCTPNPGSTGCPDCTHSGTYGADCSGFVSKAWQVPDPYAVNACDVDRFVASSFTSDHAYWDVVSMNSLQPADAVASSSHVILVIGYEDAYGEHEVVEAKGCSYGVVHQSRTFSTSYSGARRSNLSQCVCSDGDDETQACGDCGTQHRTCEGGCLWSAWSACEGPDPTGPDATCTVDGATGVCAQGTMLCVAGWLSCQPPAASAEVCDGLDNDCDGVVDNGTPASLGEGLPCTNACGEGESSCIDGAVRCVTPGTTWPDDTCNADGGDAGSVPDASPGDAAAAGGGSAAWTNESDASGCACRADASSSNTAAWPWVLLATLLTWTRRARR